MSFPKPAPSPGLILLLAVTLAVLPCAAFAADEGPSPEFEKAEYQVYKAWKAGDHEKALLLANKALSLQPDDPDMLYNIAALQALLGHKEALASLKKAAETGGMRSWKRESA